MTQQSTTNRNVGGAMTGGGNDEQQQLAFDSRCRRLWQRQWQSLTAAISVFVDGQERHGASAEKKGVNAGNPGHKNTVSGSVLCCHDSEMSVKSANIWLSGQHIANMLPTFPAKTTVMLQQRRCNFRQGLFLVSAHRCSGW